jgi:hypothetical protein
LADFAADDLVYLEVHLLLSLVGCDE